jgi:hypothetical protein
MICIGSIFFGVMNSSYAQTNEPAVQTSSEILASYFRPITHSSSAYDNPYRIALFSPENGEDGARTWSQTKSVFAYGLVAFGILAALPEESTGWEKNDDFLNKWVENVKEGPEWDRNKFAYNYIGHTYFGGVYYQVARKSGYRQWDSFIYTFLMSTFYWEYGIEAFAEVPSIQDIVFTPIAGWIYGEWAYQTEVAIRENSNEVLGSGILGGASLIFLDPVDSAGRAVNRIFSRRLIKAGYGYFSYNPAQTPDGQTDHQVYLHMRIPIGAAGPDEPNKITVLDHSNDPVDTGILGFSIGTGYTALDPNWGVSDDLYTKISLGVYFSPRVSFRLAYAWSDLEETATGSKVEYENYSLDTQIYLNTKSKFRPYLTGGFGDQVWYKDNDTATFQWNGGVGAHWRLLPKLAINADWINYYSPGAKTYDQQFNTGIIYRFGRGERNDW